MMKLPLPMQELTLGKNVNVSITVGTIKTIDDDIKISKVLYCCSTDTSTIKTTRQKVTMNVIVFKILASLIVFMSTLRVTRAKMKDIIC